MAGAGSFKKHDETVVSNTHRVSTDFVFASGESFARAPMEPERSNAPDNPSFLLVSAQRSWEEINSGTDSPERKKIGSNKEWLTSEEATRLRAPSDDRPVTVDVFVHSALLSRWPKHVLTLRTSTTVRGLEQVPAVLFSFSVGWLARSNAG